MNAFIYRFDKALASGWWLALVCLLVLIHFGGGALVSYLDKRAERADREAYRASIERKIETIKVGQSTRINGVLVLKVSERRISK